MKCYCFGSPKLMTRVLSGAHRCSMCGSIRRDGVAFRADGSPLLPSLNPDWHRQAEVHAVLAYALRDIFC